MGDADRSASPRLPVIAGPTAAGKSGLALQLAEHVGGAIVSADSRQVYRGFDVGTAKPTAAEQARVPHFGIDVADPGERYSAFRWADALGEWVHDASGGGRAPLVVGGTGLYLRVAFAPAFDEPPLDPVRRAALLSVLERMPTAELTRWCRALDPDRAVLGRTQLLRSVETALLTGERLSRLHVVARRPARMQARYLVVDPGPALAARIAVRVHAMLDRGWPEEVERLIAVVPPDAPAWKSSGYSAVRELVEGQCTRADAAERIVIETRQYAKRQRTWFRHQLAGEPVTLLDPAAPDAFRAALAWVQTGLGESAT